MVPPVVVLMVPFYSIGHQFERTQFDSFAFRNDRPLGDIHFLCVLLYRVVAAVYSYGKYRNKSVVGH